MSLPDEKITMKIGQLCIAPDNPRHEEVDGEMEAIRELCRTENIEVLARDIQLHGLSPAERLIVMAVDEDRDDPEREQYFVAEGNRRVCALKLLHDPELAPPSIRKQIKSYADKWTVIEEIDVVIIRDPDKRRFWMQRIHDGEQGGRGRKRWSSEQKTRFSGSGRNMLAQALFDYAEDEGVMLRSERTGRISHMARLVGNALAKEALGVIVDRGYDDLHRVRKKDDFDFALGIFLDEAKVKTLGSQADKSKIDNFVRSKVYASESYSNAYLRDPEPIRPDPIADIDATDGSDGDTEGESESVGGDTVGSGDGGGQGQGGRGRATKPAKRRYVPTSEAIEEELKLLANHKLQSLYYSICGVNVRDHPSLIGVGIWSFLESLASLMGSADNQAFQTFFKPGRISQMGVATGEKAKLLHKILEDLNRGGNLGKHHGIAGQFDPDQIMTNFEAVEDLIVQSLKSLTRE